MARCKSDRGLPGALRPPSARKAACDGYGNRKARTDMAMPGAMLGRAPNPKGGASRRISPVAA